MAGDATTEFTCNHLPMLALVTTALSNLIGNSAAVMLLLKVGVAQAPAAYVLALANSFGGSLVIVGSVANIIVVQQARDLEASTSAFATSPRLGRAGHAGGPRRIDRLGVAGNT